MEPVKTVQSTQELQLMDCHVVQTYVNMTKSCYSTEAAKNVSTVMNLPWIGNHVLVKKVNADQIRLK